MSRKTIWNFGRTAALVIAFLLAAQNGVWAQGKDFLEQIQGGANYVGIYYGTLRMNFDAPPDDATNEIKGYTDVLPNALEGNIAVFQFGFNSFSLNFSFVDMESDINRLADVNQTTGNSGDDVFVLAVRRKGTQISISYWPTIFTSLGLGKDRSDVIFFQRNASGSEEERTIAVDNTFLFFNLFFKLGSFKSFTPVVNLNVAIPFDSSDFSINRQSFFGTTTFLMIGFLF